MREAARSTQRAARRAFEVGNHLPGTNLGPARWDPVPAGNAARISVVDGKDLVVFYSVMW